jgi:hypothetical protein
MKEEKMKTNHTYKTYVIAGVNQLTIKDIRNISKKSGLKFNSVFKVLSAFKDVVKKIEVR